MYNVYLLRHFIQNSLGKRKKKLSESVKNSLNSLQNKDYFDCTLFNIFGGNDKKIK